MADEPRNRKQRRHPDRLEENPVLPAERPQSPEHDIAKHGGQDAESARAKSSGHGKKTADKWNQ